MADNIELISPQTDTRLKRLSCTRIVLETDETTGEIRFPLQQVVYYVTGGYGVFTKVAGGANWDYVLCQDMALWLAADVKHGWRNTGEGSLRCIRFSCQVDSGEEPIGRGTRIARLSDVFVEEETGRLLRVIFRGLDLPSKRIDTVEHVTFYPGGSSPVHSAKGMEEIFYFTRGSGEARVGEDRVEVAAGMALAIPDGVVHNVESTKGEVLQHITCNIWV